MRPFFTQTFGNAASASHSFGYAAKEAVEHAREQAAGLLNAHAPEIVWTGGATESNNLAIKGVAEAYRDKGRHIITQTTEHKSVLDVCKRLAGQGYEITWLQPDRLGRLAPEQVSQAIRPDTILVSIMAANNEIGTIQPIRQIGQLCRSAGVLFHTDATQAVSKIPIDVEADHIDLLALTGHKMYAPKGCGALYVRRKDPQVRLAPLLDGGGHEQGFRSGTLNVPSIVGVGLACELARSEMDHHAKRLGALRDRLEQGILSQVQGVSVNGDIAHRLSHVTNLTFKDVDGEMLLYHVNQDVACSSGSACSSANAEPSYVLRAIGLPANLAFASLRFSLGRPTTQEEVDFAIQTVARVVKDQRASGTLAPSQ
jgi:cysteine desulfurase